jgi:hypothetical protein
MPVQMLAPRPFSQKVWAGETSPEQQAVPQPAMTNEEMAMALLAAGALGGSVMGPRDSFATLRDPFDLRNYGGLG